MFLVNDSMESRHQKIRSFLPTEPVIAILLAACDFEWTLRRAVVALGTSTNRVVRDNVLRLCHGPDDYKRAWQEEVSGRTGIRLPRVVGNWESLKRDGYGLRNQVVHGIAVRPSLQKGRRSVDAFLRASTALAAFAETHDAPLVGRRLPVRRKRRTLASTALLGGR